MKPKQSLTRGENLGVLKIKPTELSLTQPVTSQCMTVLCVGSSVQITIFSRNMLTCIWKKATLDKVCLYVLK